MHRRAWEFEQALLVKDVIEPQDHIWVLSSVSGQGGFGCTKCGRWSRYHYHSTLAKRPCRGRPLKRISQQRAQLLADHRERRTDPSHMYEIPQLDADDSDE